jgi:hypothetical protein
MDQKPFIFCKELEENVYVTFPTLKTDSNTVSDGKSEVDPYYYF